MVRLPSLSLSQMIKAVTFPAVAFACITPMVRLRRIGLAQGDSTVDLATIAFVESFLVPLAWIALSILLIRRGPWRDGLILVLLLVPLSVAEGLACWAFIRYTIPAAWSSRRAGIYPSLIVHGLVVLAFAAAMGFLANRLWRMHQAHGTVGRDPEPTAVPS